jgi:hypothetical protein
MRADQDIFAPVKPTGQARVGFLSRCKCRTSVASSRAPVQLVAARVRLVTDVPGRSHGSATQHF